MAQGSLDCTKAFLAFLNNLLWTTHIGFWGECSDVPNVLDYLVLKDGKSVFQTALPQTGPPVPSKQYLTLPFQSSN